MHLSLLRRGSEPQAPVRGAIIIEAIPLTQLSPARGEGACIVCGQCFGQTENATERLFSNLLPRKWHGLVCC